jgi:alpha-tubulin suppressor-like RCC1 family protein
MPFDRGGNFICYEDSGGLQCSSKTTTPPVPPVLTNTSLIAAGTSHGCAIASGTLSCWGANTGYGNILNAFMSDNTVNALAAAGNATCAHSTINSVQCDGQDAANFGSIPTTLISNIQEIAISKLHVCIRNSTEVQCWGTNTYGQTTVPGNIGSVTDLTVSDRFSCVVNNGRPMCWGTPTP